MGCLTKIILQEQISSPLQKRSHTSFLLPAQQSTFGPVDNYVDQLWDSETLWHPKSIPEPRHTPSSSSQGHKKETRSRKLIPLASSQQLCIWCWHTWHLQIWVRGHHHNTVTPLSLLLPRSECEWQSAIISLLYLMNTFFFSVMLATLGLWHNPC